MLGCTTPLRYVPAASAGCIRVWCCASFARPLVATLAVAEAAAKVIYNAHGHPAPFDPDAGWWLPEALDLVISLISWGFHYPVAVYADQVREILRPGGRVILDVRKGTDGREQLEARFPRVLQISETRKKERLCAEL